MSTADTRAGRFYWEWHTDGDGRWNGPQRPAGAVLAALRRGQGRPVGEVPAMWPFYRNLTADGHVRDDLRAEHVALTLFAVHQQAKEQPMHRVGVGLGSALLALRRSGKYSPEAVDRRFAAAATATSLTELVGHLRGLITQLRSVDVGGRRGQGLDYTQLVRDLRAWQRPDRAGWVRRRWGSQYFAPRNDNATNADPPPTPDNPGLPESTSTVKESQ